MNDALALLFVAGIVGLRLWGEIAYRAAVDGKSRSNHFDVLQVRGYLEP